MSFRLLPNSLNFGDFERRNSPNCRVILPNSVDFGTDYVKVVEDAPILFAAARQAKESSFWRYIIYGDIGSESVEMRHSALTSENLTNNQP